MRTAWVPLTACVAFLLQGCLKVDVTTTMEPGVDFSAVRTFAHAPQGPGALPFGQGGLVRDVVREEIESQLTSKGFELAPIESANIVVAWQARAVSQQRLRDAGDPDANFYVVRDYIHGTLVIDVFYTGASKPAWHGVGQVNVDSEANAQSAARRAVRAILSRFPARSDA